MSISIGGGFNAARINPYSTPCGSQPQATPAQTPPQQVENENRSDFVKTSDKGISLLEKMQDAPERRQTIYDQPTLQASKAISAYSALANMDRRSEVQSLIGVDIYA